MTTRRYEDDLASELHRRIWPIIDVRSRIERATRAAELPASPRRRSA